MPSDLAGKLLGVLDQLSGGVHPGFRPVHAKGVMFSGTFVPSPDAAELTRAPHASRPSTPVTVRFSASSGIPAVADNASEGSSPQGMATRFHLAEHVHTDIIAHSFNGFPARTGEEFWSSSGRSPRAGRGLRTRRRSSHFWPITRRRKPSSRPRSRSRRASARQPYFAINAFKFTNAGGQSRFGRFRLVPDAGTEFLTPDQASRKTADFLAAEMSERLSKGSGDLPRAGANGRGR